MSDFLIRKVQPYDAAAICDIYNHHVLHTIVTFEEEPVTVTGMERRIADVTLRYPWLVYHAEGHVVAYTYATTWKIRSAYRHTVEAAIYVAEEKTGRGVGRRLYTQLIAELKELGIHCIIGGIALPNEGSIKLHESLGFRKIGEFNEVGKKFGNWINVGYWTLII